jgi:hypothetical protein
MGEEGHIIQGICAEVAQLLDEVAEDPVGEEVHAPAVAPSRFAAAVQASVEAATASGINPLEDDGR